MQQWALRHNLVIAEGGCARINNEIKALWKAEKDKKMSTDLTGVKLLPLRQKKLQILSA